MIRVMSKTLPVFTRQYQPTSVALVGLKLEKRLPNSKGDRPPVFNQVIFKLFELLKREFLVGYICTECLTLLEQADSLQFQLHAVIKVRQINPSFFFVSIRC